MSFTEKERKQRMEQEDGSWHGLPVKNHTEVPKDAPDNAEMHCIGGWSRYFIDGKAQPRPDGTPSEQHDDGSYECRVDGLLHRNPKEGPAVWYNYINPDTGEKGTAIEYRVEGDLHRLDGPACFRQGYKAQDQPVRYRFWNVEVPPSWTDPGGLTSKAILKEENAEVRRVGIQAYGIEKFIDETIAKIIDADMDNRNDARALVLLEDNTKWFVGTDGSTGRVYYMRASDDNKTCSEAYESITGLKDDDCIAAG